MGREGPYRVLHVEEDGEYAATVTDRLEAGGDFAVATEASPADAVERLAAGSFECLVADHRVPDGLEFVRRVRDAHPDLPILLLTGRGSEAVAGEAIAAGATDHVTKSTEPAKLDVLANRIETAVERYRAERALREERRRNEEFLRLVAHDLRNPMAVTRGWLDLLHEHGERTYYEKARSGLDRMADILDNLEQLALGGETAIADEPVELSSVATAAWEVTETGDAALRAEFGPKLLADASLLQQALENLFDNAVVHGGDVTVRVGVTDDREGFYVADDGPGVPEGDRERIFASGVSGGEGSGLGLALVRRVADAHGWTVSAGESDRGGARFTFHGVTFDDPTTGGSLSMATTRDADGSADQTSGHGSYDRA